MLALRSDPNELVTCPDCQWRGQVAACIVGDGIVKCPLDGTPVEEFCEAPTLVLASYEADPNATTK